LACKLALDLQETRIYTTSSEELHCPSLPYKSKTQKV
jgi:hypothetical protein